MGIMPILLFVLAVGFLVIVGYNQLVRRRQSVSNAWSQVDVQLKRRHDLIPNLVEAAKGYLAHEHQTLENVTKARTQAIQTDGVRSKADAENALTQTLRSLFAVVERYPDLRANQNILALQEALTSTENRLSFARQLYNGEAMRLNTAIQSVPTNLIAQLFGFKPAEFFELEDPAHREVPQAKLT